MDAVQKANSGHPGMPMGMADIAEVLWRRFLRHNPANPRWPDRDRFLLSNGHGSMLQYALLHLTGYDLPMEELRALPPAALEDAGPPGSGRHAGRRDHHRARSARGSPTPWASRSPRSSLAAQFNRPGHAIVDHHTYVFVGDGCLMEGISHEACSLAGTLGLAKLVAFYDDNGISIDGKVAGLVPRRHAQALRGLRLERDPARSTATIRKPSHARSSRRTPRPTRPTLICCKTIIGKGAPNAGRHREGPRRAAGRREVAATREALGWNYPPFEIPRIASIAHGTRARAGKSLEADWDSALRRLREGASRSWRASSGAASRATCPRASPNAASRRSWPRPCRKAETVATRKASPARAGGARRRTCRSSWADPRTSPAPTSRSGRARSPSARPKPGNYIHYGVREFGMAAIVQRPGAPRRLHPLLRHLPHLLRLLAQRAAHGRADEGAQHLRLHPRLHRPGRGRADAPVGRACGEPAPHPQHGRLAPLRHGRDRDRVGDGARAARRPERASRSRARTCRSRSATPEAIAAIRRGGYVLSDAPGRRARSIIATGSEVRARARRAEVARRSGHAGARRLDALHQPLRPPGRGVARSGAAQGPAARGRRGRRHRLLAQVRGPRRRGGRPRPLRRVGAGRGRVQIPRRRHRAPRGGGAGALSADSPLPEGPRLAPRAAVRLARSRGRARPSRRVQRELALDLRRHPP